MEYLALLTGWRLEAIERLQLRYTDGCGMKRIGLAIQTYNHVIFQFECKNRYLGEMSRLVQQLFLPWRVTVKHYPFLRKSANFPVSGCEDYIMQW